MSPRRITSILCAVICALFLLILVSLNFPLSGMSVTAAVLGNDTRSISKIGPEVRTRVTTGYQEILDSPVYFDYRFMPWMRSLHLTIVYRENGRQLSGFGLQNGPDFHYNVLRQFETIDLGNGLRQASIDIATNVLYRNRNVTRFLIETTPTADATGTLDIYSLSIQSWR